MSSRQHYVYYYHPLPSPEDREVIGRMLDSARGDWTLEETSELESATFAVSSNEDEMYHYYRVIHPQTICFFRISLNQRLERGESVSTPVRPPVEDCPLFAGILVWWDETRKMYFYGHEPDLPEEARPCAEYNFGKRPDIEAFIRGEYVKQEPEEGSVCTVL